MSGIREPSSKHLFRLIDGKVFHRELRRTLQSSRNLCSGNDKRHMLWQSLPHPREGTCLVVRAQLIERIEKQHERTLRRRSRHPVVESHYQRLEAYGRLFGDTVLLRQLFAQTL